VPAPARAARVPGGGSASAPLSGAADDARYQSKLAASGIFDDAPAPRTGGKPAPARREESVEPAPETGPPAEDAPEPSAKKTGRRTAAAAPAAPPPAKRAPAKPQGAWVKELEDELFAKAVEASLERGAASAVLLTRRLGIGYGKAQALVDRLAKAGVLGEVTPNGARPVLIRREDLDAAR
jgi:DNA segregation ATPase FtsK/SpoIIIE-like protein